jgi:UDP-N-acetylmuramoyl-L-alanyl-D-glutamate--2,6-diaminopimelate ligase
MKLKQLFSIFGKVEWRGTSSDHQVQGVFSDSRKIIKDAVFVATTGVNSNGHSFISNAINQGAIALVVESMEEVPDDFTGAVLQVLDSKIAYAELLREYFSRPEEKLITIGITGTNGKTSSSYILESILNDADVPCGVIGTIDHHYKATKWKTDLTTPDTASLYQRLHDFSELGAKAVVLEVSSHSLKQQRIPLIFDIAIFTNFTRDHLDYHKTMEDYFASKQLLFEDRLKETGDVFAILNIDDAEVAKTKVAKSAQKYTFGQAESDFQFTIKNSSLDGIDFTVSEKALGIFEYKTTMVGVHNVYNLVGAIAAARAWGVPHTICQRAIKKFTGIPGRLERVVDPKHRHVFVDYAHTPDALEKVLKNLSELKTQHNTSTGGSAKLITVFGCGGDRDRGKRPLMAQVAEKFSDTVIVTSDNPRREEPEAIIDEIFKGFKKSDVLREVDRATALQKAVDISRPGDVVLIAGKGHEDYQLIGDKTICFSDVEVMTTKLTEGQP